MSGREIIATRMADHWFFLCGFGKNERSNIDKDELKVFQKVARELLAFDDQKQALASTGEIVEVCNDNA